MAKIPLTTSGSFPGQVSGYVMETGLVPVRTSYPLSNNVNVVSDVVEHTPINRGNNVGNVQFKGSPSRLARAKAALKDGAAVVKNGLGNVPLRVLGNAALGLSGMEAIAHTAAKARYDDPSVRADWQRFQDSNYLDPSTMPDIHDEYLSEDARQAIMQMAPAANALNLRKNQLDVLSGLANVAEEERALQNATQDLLANDAVVNAVNDSRDPGTQAYLAQQAKSNTSAGTGTTKQGVKGSGNSLDPLMGLLGLLALGGGAYYLGKKL
jgi:hypothetical protein